jgi:excisionase family DNA binding protein
MAVEPNNKQIREFITTGQAASLCSVTPDTVLKWIKAGKIPASRTPGGHYRISRSDVEQFITPGYPRS